MDVDTNQLNGQNLGNRTKASRNDNTENRTNRNNGNNNTKTEKNKRKKQDPNIRKKIKFLNTNAQSLQFKLSELEDKLEKEEIQIAGITESWGQPWKEDILNIKGYHDYRKHRNDGRRGGGCIGNMSRIGNDTI